VLWRANAGSTQVAREAWLITVVRDKKGEATSAAVQSRQGEFVPTQHGKLRGMDPPDARLVKRPSQSDPMLGLAR